MTDLSKLTLTELDAHKRNNTRALDAYTEQNEAIVAEIERRKAEPDWAAWEAKWQAFCGLVDWISPAAVSKHQYIRALFAAHNTPLAGEWVEYSPEKNGFPPMKVSIKSHEIERMDEGVWFRLSNQPSWWAGFRYRYRPRQS